jgi:IS5 family transposase
MIPKKEDKSSLYKIPLKRLLNSNHPLYRMAEAIDWAVFEDAFTPHFYPDNGRPGIPTRVMVGLHYLKYSEDLSDEDVVEKWVQNPYWQYFCGEEYFEHEFPIHPTSMTRWRKKIEKVGAEELLKETIMTGFREKVFRKKDLERVNVDTTVQESLDKADEMTGDVGKIRQAFADGGYKGSGYEGEIEVHIVKKGLRKKKDPVKKWMKRRSAVEADIGHLKNDCGLKRNYLSGVEGNAMNAILAATGFNFRKLLRAFLRQILLWLISLWKRSFASV